MRKLVTGWGAFGTAKGFSFVGAGAIALREADPLLTLIDSAAARRWFWQRCLSVHCSGASDAPLIFSIRERVYDTAGRPGFCGIAFALQGEALRASPGTRSSVLGAAEALLAELQHRGCSLPSRRFALGKGGLQAFILEHGGFLGAAVSSGQQGQNRCSRPTNDGRAQYWALPASWERVLKENWLELAFAQAGANFYLYRVEKAPQIKGLGLSELSETALDNLVRDARMKLGERASKRTGVSSARSGAGIVGSVDRAEPGSEAVAELEDALRDNGLLSSSASRQPYASRSIRYVRSRAKMNVEDFAGIIGKRRWRTHRGPEAEVERTGKPPIWLTAKALFFRGPLNYRYVAALAGSLLMVCLIGAGWYFVFGSGQMALAGRNPGCDFNRIRDGTGRVLLRHAGTGTKFGPDAYAPARRGSRMRR